MMANIQKSFLDFHNAIKLDVDDNSLLKKYKDDVIAGLQEELSSEIKFETFLQGSYSTYTGIKSCDANIDFDIDIAVAFEISREDYSNPTTPKLWIKEALTKIFPDAEVKLKVPCVTATFKGKDSEKNVHVDVAVYANDNDQYYLAKGKEFSIPENRCWDIADPKGLKNKINTHLIDENDRMQFRRCIRYLKRWKDNKFNQEHRPTGIGLTINTMNMFSVSKTTDLLAGTTTYDDLLALKNLVQSMKNSFLLTYDEASQEYRYRILAKLPVQPYTDTYCKMTFNQMEDFKAKLEKLSAALDFAYETIDDHDATVKLNTQFGNDFEIIPEEEVTENNLKNSFITDYPSA